MTIIEITADLELLSSRYLEHVILQNKQGEEIQVQNKQGEEIEVWKSI